MSNMYEEFLERAKQAPKINQEYEQTKIIKRAFDDDFVLSSPDAYVKTSNIDLLRNELADRSELGKPIVMFGPSRSGKTSAARYITKGFNKGRGDKIVQYIQYNENFWDWWDSADFQDTRILFLDGIFPIWNDLVKSSFDDLNSRSKFDKMIIVPIVSSIEYYWLRKRLNTVSPKIFGHDPSVFEFSKSDESEIISILKQRYKTIGKTNPFSRGLLKKISNLSLGLPGLALWIARHLLRSVQGQQTNRVLTVNDLERIDNILNFTPSIHIIRENNSRISQEDITSINPKIWDIEPLIAISSFEQKLKQFKKITRSRFQILEEMVTLDQIHGTIKRSELQERTGVKDSTLTYQCQSLVNDNLITYMKDGREVFYQLPTPTKEALELLFFE